jgi:hypothetical protein
MKRILPLAVLATILVPLPLAAQPKPDFSGEWILNRQASTLSPGADAMQSAVLRIEHREPTFRYNAEFVSASGPIRYEYEMLTDGRDVAATQQGVRSTSTLRWDENVLVFTGRIHRPDGDLTVSFRYELVDDGRRLRAVEQLRGRGRDQDNVWIFDRR